MDKTEKIVSDSTKVKIAKGAGVTILSIIMLGGIGVVMIIVGIILSLTIIGAIIGIPLIILGIMTVVLSPFGGITTVLKGKRIGLAPKGVIRQPCPYCKNEVTFIKEKALNCPVCQKRLLVKDGTLSLVE